ncbi:hypothetical protein JOD31_001258 [Methylopila capsulata]|uniref:Uncharacterized protein n=1 Tax=Methylopila capsulata TaxID=61654 RepID=A0ABS2T4E5_9HYPH|nr:hypothetical protein [Methylopila capsulata]MBM7851033.1 hypothetical protein [Methylopila capsulata]
MKLIFLIVTSKLIISTSAIANNLPYNSTNQHERDRADFFETIPKSASKEYSREPWLNPPATNSTNQHARDRADFYGSLPKQVR